MHEPTYWVLATLAGGRRHGYAILTDVADLSEGRVRLRVTTLYAALERLSREGLILEDGAETVDGRRRRYFVLTQAGADALQAEAQRMTHASVHATQRLRAYGWTRPAGTH